MPQCEVNVLLNDSIGTFAGGRYLDPDIMIGIILGTGTNMAYLERKAMIHNVAKKLPPGYSDEMLINSEWGCYDSPLLPVCPATAVCMLTCKPHWADLLQGGAKGCKQAGEHSSSTLVGLHLGSACLLSNNHCQDLHDVQGTQGPFFHARG